jgi:hypothetical protein
VILHNETKLQSSVTFVEKEIKHTDDEAVTAAQQKLRFS